PRRPSRSDSAYARPRRRLSAGTRPASFYRAWGRKARHPSKEYLMQMKNVALALAVAAAGLVGGHAFAQDHVTIQRDTPYGVVTKHIERREDGSVRRVVVHRPDGTTVIRRVARGYDRDHDRGYGYGEHHWRDRDDVR